MSVFLGKDLCISVPTFDCVRLVAFLVVFPFGSVLNHYLLVLKWMVVIQQIRRKREYYVLQGLRFSLVDKGFFITMLL